MAFEHEMAKEEDGRDPEILAMIHYIFSVIASENCQHC